MRLLFESRDSDASDSDRRPSHTYLHVEQNSQENRDRHPDQNHRRDGAYDNDETPDSGDDNNHFQKPSIPSPPHRRTRSRGSSTPIVNKVPIVNKYPTMSSKSPRRANNRPPRGQGAGVLSLKMNLDRFKHTPASDTPPRSAFAAAFASASSATSTSTSTPRRHSGEGKSLRSAGREARMRKRSVFAKAYRRYHGGV